MSANSAIFDPVRTQFGNVGAIRNSHDFGGDWMSKRLNRKAEMNPGRFAVKTVRSGADELVQLSGEMDLSVIGSVDREMCRVEEGDASRIVLDLSELEFLDASGIRLLLHLNARSRSNGGRLRITRAHSPQVQRVFELTGAADVLPLLD